VRAALAGRSFENRHPEGSARSPRRGKADGIHQVAGLDTRRLFGLDDQSAGSVLNEDRVARVAPGDHTLHSHAPAGDLGGSELHQAVHRKDGKSVGVGGRRLIHRDLVNARRKDLDTDELPSIVKQGAARTANRDRGVHQVAVIPRRGESL
jgi:hypothetical protein